MKKFYQSAACLLILAAAAGLFSCGSETGKPAETEPKKSETQPTVTEADTEETDPNTAGLQAVVDALPDVDYEGYTFTVADWGTADSAPTDVFSEGEDGEPINDAVFKRNTILEDSLNIKITEFVSDNPSATVKKTVSAGEDAYDAVIDGLFRIAGLTPSNILYNVYEIPEIVLDNPWWDPQITRDLSACEKLYLLSGDILTSDNDGTWCVLFNKKLTQEFDLDDPYTKVENGTWTLDAMHDMMKAVAGDLNGDGVMDEADRWGCLGERYNTYALWSGSGNRIIDVDEDDTPYLSMYSENASDVFDRVLDLMFDSSCSGVILANVFTDYDVMFNCFREGRALFHIANLGMTITYRDVKDDFGILPMPKYNAEQDRYYNTFTCYGTTAYGIPVTGSDISRTGTIIEAMAATSKYLLTPAYYDITLVGKAVRDAQSEAMIELILNTRSYDLGCIFQWGKSFAIFTDSFAKDRGTFTSKYEKEKDRTNKKLDEYVAGILENDT